MNRLQLYRRRFVRIVAMLGVVGFGNQIAWADSAQDLALSSPTLFETSVMLESPGKVTVRGQNFTPGGEVYVIFHGPQGEQLHEPYWVIASETVHGSNGSQDPATGFSRGGSIDLVVRTSYNPVHGPNGSQDPALGSVCGETAVTAYDAHTDQWSNMIDADLGC